jgi:hypothetical protein
VHGRLTARVLCITGFGCGSRSRQTAIYAYGKPWWLGYTGVRPNLMFPGDRSWLVSTLWDDDWTCIGGPAGLAANFVRHPALQARPVVLDQDATPPGHQAF